jgi:hypothetical protein
MAKGPKFELEYALMARAAQDVIDNPTLSPAEALTKRLAKKCLEPEYWYLPDALLPVMAMKIGFVVFGEHEEDYYHPSDFNLEKIFREAA